MQHVAIRDCRENIKYILWKADLHRLNFDEATGTTVGDPTRNRLVVGKTGAVARQIWIACLAHGGLTRP